MPAAALRLSSHVHLWRKMQTTKFSIINQVYVVSKLYCTYNSFEISHSFEIIKKKIFSTSISFIFFLISFSLKFSLLTLYNISGLMKNHFFPFSHTREYPSFPSGSHISNDHYISKTDHDIKRISAKLQKLLFIFMKMLQYGESILRFPICAPGQPDSSQFQCGNHTTEVINFSVWLVLSPWTLQHTNTFTQLLVRR